jgi:aryl-alcohol dehydrogenase
VLGGDNEAVVEQVRKQAGDGPHYCIDTTGVPDVIVSAIDSLRARGTCASVGLQNGELVLAENTLPGKQLVAAIEGDTDPKSFIPYLIQLWRDGQFPFDRLLKHFSFAAINEAEQSSLEGWAVKPVLVMD